MLCILFWYFRHGFDTNLLNHFTEFTSMTDEDQSKEMKNLLQKEKKLRKEIHSDYEKISQKTNDDLDKIKKAKNL